MARMPQSLADRSSRSDDSRDCSCGGCFCCDSVVVADVMVVALVAVDVVVVVLSYKERWAALVITLGWSKSGLGVPPIVSWGEPRHFDPAVHFCSGVTGSKQDELTILTSPRVRFHLDSAMLQHWSPRWPLDLRVWLRQASYLLDLESKSSHNRFYAGLLGASSASTKIF